MSDKLCSVEYATKIIFPGYKHVLEFGVWKGDSIRKMRSRLNDSYKLYGFDSFEGLPEDWVDGKGNLVGKGKKGRFSTGGDVPDVPNVKWMVGWFNETLPKYLEEAENIGILHIDCDLYSSTKEVLWALNDYIKKGTIIVFDEWFYNHSTKFKDHEQKAFYEWIKEFDRKFSFVDFEDPTDIRNPKGKRYETSERKIVKVIE